MCIAPKTSECLHPLFFFLGRNLVYGLDGRIMWSLIANAVWRVLGWDGHGPWVPSLPGIDFISRIFTLSHQGSAVKISISLLIVTMQLLKALVVHGALVALCDSNHAVPWPQLNYATPRRANRWFFQTFHNQCHPCHPNHFSFHPAFWHVCGLLLASRCFFFLMYELPWWGLLWPWARWLHQCWPHALGVLSPTAKWKFCMTSFERNGSKETVIFTGDDMLNQRYTQSESNFGCAHVVRTFFLVRMSEQLPTFDFCFHLLYPN